jgi:hypothetical protein
MRANERMLYLKPRPEGAMVAAAEAAVQPMEAAEAKELTLAAMGDKGVNYKADETVIRSG